MTYDIRAKIALIGILLVTLATLTGNIFGWRWAAAVWLWLVCALVAVVWIEDPVRQPALRRHFSGRDYRAFYRPVARRLARWPRDWRLYDWALRLAVFYPIGLLVLLWALTGRPGTIGAFELLHAEPRWGPRLAAIGAMALALSGPLLGKWAAASPKRGVRRISGWLPVFAVGNAVGGAFAVSTIVAGEAPVGGAFAVAGAVAVAAAVAGAFEFAVAGAGAAAVTFAVAFNVALVVAVPFAVVVVVVVVAVVGGAFAVAAAGAVADAGAAEAAAAAVAIAAAAIKSRGNLAYPVFSVALAASLGLCLALLPWDAAQPGRNSIFLFFGILPLLNAVFDYVSYAITLTLIGCGLRAGWAAALIGAVDLILALGLFTAAGTALVLVVARANALAGVPLYPLAPLFAGVRQDPGAYLWLYLMLFSTIVPTLLHFAIASFALTGIVPQRWRLGLVGWIGDPGPVPASAAPLVIGAIWTLSLTLPFAAMYGLYLIIAAFWPSLLAEYLAIFEAVARWAGALPTL